MLPYATLASYALVAAYQLPKFGWLVDDYVVALEVIRWRYSQAAVLAVEREVAVEGGHYGLEVSGGSSPLGRRKMAARFQMGFELCTPGFAGFWRASHRGLGAAV